MLATRLGVEPGVRFLADLAAGAFIVEPVAASDWLCIAELVARYRDLPLGTVDASVLATIERLGAIEIATLDRRHFSVVRPAHTMAIALCLEAPVQLHRGTCGVRPRWRTSGPRTASQQ